MMQTDMVESDQVEPLTDHDGLQAAVDVQLIKGVLDVVAHGSFAHAHHRGDLAGRISFGEQFQNLVFPLGQGFPLEVPIAFVVAVVVLTVFHEIFRFVADVHQQAVTRITGYHQAAQLELLAASIGRSEFDLGAVNRLVARGHFHERAFFAAIAIPKTVLAGQ